MKLVSMKVSKAEREKRSEPCKIESPSYPYGTCLRLEKEALAKLGLKLTGLKVGDKFVVQAVGEVKSLRHSEGHSYDSNEVEIQLTTLGLEKQASGSSLAAIEKGIKEAGNG
jgi:hypothetical protein